MKDIYLEIKQKTHYKFNKEIHKIYKFNLYLAY